MNKIGVGHGVDLVYPSLESLLSRIDSRFELVVVAGKRARQINEYYSSLGQSRRGVVPPQVASLSGKALTIAFEEIADGHVESVEEEALETPVGGVAGDQAGGTEGEVVGLLPEHAGDEGPEDEAVSGLASDGDVEGDGEGQAEPG